MELRNETSILEFLLMEVTENPELQSLIFSLFLSMYLVTILGNLLIVLAVSLDSHLHTPMYFFLSNLSFVDICLTSTTIPKMLVNIKTHSKPISYTGCLIQICFVFVFASLDSCILSVMAYDRYVAICHPLRYNVIMNSHLCGLLILLSLFISIVDALAHSLVVLQLTCADLEIPLFFCEVVQVIKFACSDTLINNILIYFATSIFGGILLCGIIFSYTQIVSSVLRMPPAGGKYKVRVGLTSQFSLFYGTGFGVYISSALADSSRNAAMLSMMYTVVPQMMNTFIYNLRNRAWREP
ncbi:olfactory receptor 7G1-like [Panthera tigris]|uniref:olfactory receptor 7G1-like n=1 Tax=Panthera tigris TaxID=9694 RepID=UPI001C6F8CED|nr:olfactory receptor 7G1-like [Panthera tigris]